MNEYFCHVENGEIKQYRIRRGSTFQGKRLGKKSPDSTYKALNLWPVVGAKPEYDSQSQTCYGPQYVLDTENEEVQKIYTVQDIPVETLKAKNADAAKRKQAEVITKLSENKIRKDLGLPPDISDTDETILKEYTKQVQADIDNPPESVTYNPPLPPGVTPPSVSSILITLTREEGWQGDIGWRAVITAGEENFTPANLAIAEYTNPDCDGYLYTTGAFQQEDNTWYTVCPPGQEKGDVDINLGLLYGAAKLACFTFQAGQQEMKIYAYEEN